jgi:hypothetical protein
MDLDLGQSRKTPERLLVAGHNEGTNTSSPLNLPVTSHNADELARRTIPGAIREISEEYMWDLLGETEVEMSRRYTSLPAMETVAKTVGARTSRSNYEQYTKYLKKISETVHKQLG